MLATLCRPMPLASLESDPVVCSLTQRARATLRSCPAWLRRAADLDSYGAAFTSLKDNLDLSTPSGRLMFQIVGAMAEFESSLIAERIRAGMLRRRLEGLPLGRAPLAVDHQPLVRDRLSGMSLTRVSKKYGVSRASVVRFARAAMKGECPQVGAFLPAAAQAPAECVA